MENAGVGDHNMIAVRNIDPAEVRKMMAESGFTGEQDQSLRRGFVVEGMSFSGLCQCIAEVPGVTFINRRRFFWWSDSIRASFTFQGHAFTIQPDGWDDGLWVQAVSDAADVPQTNSIQQHILEHGKSRWALFQKLKRNRRTPTTPPTVFSSRADAG
jgi:hypothetical protein